MHTRWIELEVDGLMMPAYAATPDVTTRGGVVVIHEIFGVDENMRHIVDLLAGAGYDALAPAMFHRIDPAFVAGHDDAGYAKGRAAAGQTTPEHVTADLGAAAAWLRARPDATGKVATWGFCFGGSLAFLSATFPFVDAALSFYGAQVARLGDRPGFIAVASQLRAPLLLAYGAKDPYITADDIAAIRRALEEHGKPFELHVYPDEDHGFFRHGPDRAMSTPGARDVWPLVRAFLAAHIG